MGLKSKVLMEEIEKKMEIKEGDKTAASMDSKDKQ